MEELYSLCQTRIGANCGTDHKLLILNIRIKLKRSTKRIVVPKYNVNNIPDGFEVHRKNRPLNLID